MTSQNRAETNKIWGYALAVGVVLFLVLKFPAGYSFWPALFLAILIAILFAILFWIAFFRGEEEAGAPIPQPAPAPSPAKVTEPAPVVEAEKPAEKPKAAKKATAPKKTAAAGKDDLKKIKGLGPAMEKKLNEAGFASYEQIGALKKADAAALDEKLGLGGRIERDEWVKQAKALAKGK